MTIKELYHQLDKLQSAKATESKLSGVFHTYVGPNYGTDGSDVKLMLVGKATAGWNLGGRPPGEDHSIEFLEKEIIPGKYHSSFWYFLKNLALALHNDPKFENDNEIFRSVVWSNVMKIAQGGSNPSRDVAKMQRGICLELLKQEVETLEPTHLVFVTGNTYWRDVQNLLPVEWSDHASDYWEARYAKTKVFWTRHPQGWERNRRDEVIDLIVHA